MDITIFYKWMRTKNKIILWLDHSNEHKQEAGKGSHALVIGVFLFGFERLLVRLDYFYTDNALFQILLTCSTHYFFSSNNISIFKHEFGNVFCSKYIKF